LKPRYCYALVIDRLVLCRVGSLIPYVVLTPYTIFFTTFVLSMLVT